MVRPIATSSPSLLSLFPPAELYYLASGFPAQRLHIPVLRQILLAHDVSPPPGPKDRYVQAFEKYVFGNRGGILRARAGGRGDRERARQGKKQGAQFLERDNHLTAAFLDEEWYFLAPGFDVRILNKPETQEILEKHGLFRRGGARSKDELVTLSEDNVGAIRDEVLHTHSQQARELDISRVVDSIKIEDDSDEEVEPEYDAVATDAIDTEDDSDEGDESELDAANPGVRSPSAHATSPRVRDTTPTYANLRSNGQEKTNHKSADLGLARASNVSNRGQTPKAVAQARKVSTQKQADNRLRTASATKTPVMSGSSHDTRSPNPPQVFTRSDTSSRNNVATAPTSLGASHSLAHQYDKLIEDLTQRFNMFERAARHIDDLTRRMDMFECAAASHAHQIKTLRDRLDLVQQINMT